MAYLAGWWALWLKQLEEWSTAYGETALIVLGVIAAVVVTQRILSVFFQLFIQALGMFWHWHQEGTMSRAKRRARDKEYMEDLCSYVTSEIERRVANKDLEREDADKFYRKILKVGYDCNIEPTFGEKPGWYKKLPHLPAWKVKKAIIFRILASGTTSAKNKLNLILRRRPAQKPEKISSLIARR